MGYNQQAFDLKVREILDLDKLGLPLSEELLGEVRAAGAMPAMKEGDASGDPDDNVADIYDGRKHLWLYKTPEKRTDEPNYYDRIPKEWHEEWKGKEITKADWMPTGAPEELDEELRRFVLSCNPRFDKLVAYKKFWLYCEQAYRWYQENGRIEDCKTESAQEAYAMQEFDRVRENKLYGLDKYATIKDEAIPGGRRTYRASTPQALLMYLKDCRFSYVLLKGRQAAITSTMMAATVLTALVTPSYKGGLVVDKEKTGLGIFNDKFKSTFQFLPEWWKPEGDGLWSNKMVQFDFDPGTRKSDKRRFTAELSTYPASDPQTINSTSMTETLFDEAQKMDNLEFILGELMPTQIAMIDDELKMVRQAMVWGTGGSGDLGKGALESHFNGVMGQLENGEQTDGWFAIFFDAFCRPGMDEKRFRKEHQKYMRGKDGQTQGMTTEQKQALFAAHYPMSVADCFMSSVRTGIPQIIIKTQRDRIIAKPFEQRGEFGHYEPVFDIAQPMPAGSYLPYKLKGSKFIKAKDGDFDVPVWRFRPPNNGYTGRYVQGSDPIQSETGQSWMGSGIWDGAARIITEGSKKIYVPTLAATMNYRTTKPKDTFLQAILMGMDYRNYGQTKCRELVEVEQGHNYLDFHTMPFIDTEDCLIQRGELPPKFSGGQHPYGISMKKERKSRAHIELIEMTTDNWWNIWSLPFWNQIATIETKERQDGSVEWSTKDERRYRDDLVFGGLYAYIGWKALNETPRLVGGDDAPMMEKQMVAKRDGNDQLHWVEEEVEVEYV